MRLSPSDPLRDQEFEGLMRGIRLDYDQPKIAVALSGGPDSLALAWLLKNWVQSRNGTLVGLTVDHQLRSESSGEAAAMAALFQSWSLEHHTLKWQRLSEAGRGQTEARRARHRLLAQACQNLSVMHLAMAHHLDDQAETVLQRLARRSGPKGLAAMRPVSVRNGCRIIRPLLAIPKERLIDTCTQAGLQPVDDPTNKNLDFDRPKLRRQITIDGDDRQRRRTSACAAASKYAAEIDTQIESAASAYLFELMKVRDQGYAWLYPERLSATSPLAAENALGRLIAAIGGAEYLRGEAVSDLLSGLNSSATKFQGRTVGGAYLRSARDSAGQRAILVCREPANLASVTVNGEILNNPICHWDNRFDLNLNAQKFSNFSVKALGDRAAKEYRKIWDCPADVARTLPGLWQNGEIVALPQFSFHDRLELAGTLATFKCSWRPRRPLMPIWHEVDRNAVC